ncbi:MAG: ATP-grasp domain-containing protein [Balneolaceae bacterium]|nr:ATP-grasp domain-containing protein [Balneolaceae bacterium]
MINSGVPVVPGSDGEVTDPEEAKKICADIGYPVIIKASAGGGGRGMRIVHEEEKLEQAFDTCRNEAETAFGNPGVYIEKFVVNPHHVEIQVMGDRHGNAVHLGERDCSLQRRHQKILEEAPSPLLTPELREEMGQAAVDAALSVDYEGAGTVEFLVDADHNFYFMEMNTRIQVEHPVTEEITDCDLVAEQIKVAAGMELNLGPLKMRGHAIECRINAEDPAHNFRPSPGTITVFHLPGGHSVRMDTHAYSGYRIPPHYDSMIAKLIVSASTREEAINRMRRALSEFVVEGVKTTIPYHLQLMDDENFRRGTFHTKYLENEFTYRNPES